MKRVAYSSCAALLGFGALVVALACAPSQPAVIHLDPSGTVLAGHKNNIGNGANNHNAVSINSPTSNKGLVAISNSNAGGRNSTRGAVCKKKHVCWIAQR